MSDDPDWVPEWEEQPVATTRSRSTRAASPDTPAPVEKRAKTDTGTDNMDFDPTHLAKPPLKIAAFNIQVFGNKKLEQKGVSDVLKKILCRYDIVVVQEVRDKSNTALDHLLEDLNTVDPDNPFTFVVSERLGRTYSKEQYAIFYREKLVSVKETFQYDDGEDNGLDTFQREPFAVRFSSPTSEVEDFGIIAVHTDPDDAVKEINGLEKVYEVTKKRWNNPNIIIAGDFNADEGYVNKDDWDKIALHNDRRFKWLIDDETDTTVKNTDRAYDRFVVAGKQLMANVVPGSTGAYKFDEDLGLTDEQAEEVSDHYPIEMKLKGKLNRPIQRSIHSGLTFTVTDTPPKPSDEMLRSLEQTPFGPDTAHFVCQVRQSKTTEFDVAMSRQNVERVIDALMEFRAKFPGFVSDGTIATARGLMESSLMRGRPFVYGLDGTETCLGEEFDITLSFVGASVFETSLTVEKRLSNVAK